MKKFNFLLAVSLFLFISMMGCKKDEPTPCELLEGNWQCESWREDGEEQLGSLAYISYSEVDFDKLAGDKGDFDWTANYTDGTSEVFTGKYEVNATCSEITLTVTGYDVIELEFEISNDELTLDGPGVDWNFKRD